MKKELKDFGLTDNEIEIYLALLRIGTSTPAMIAKKTGLSRTYIYDALDRLLEKEIVSIMYINNNKNYSAAEPERIKYLAEQKMLNIQKIVPQLQKIMLKTNEEIKINCYQGHYIYRTLLQDIMSTLKKNDECLIYGLDDTYLLENFEYYEMYVKRYFEFLKKNNIKERIIAKRGTTILKEAKTSSYKYLLGKKIGNVIFEVYENKVGIILLGKPLNLILIENKQIADSYKNQFEMLWKVARGDSKF